MSNAAEDAQPVLVEPVAQATPEQSRPSAESSQSEPVVWMTTESIRASQPPPDVITRAEEGARHFIYQPDHERKSES